ncbi:MAG: hypothetical protein NVV73_07535 [Cellvibrionaceae bacterium]|nr:hypothetical protein [Cellvibrionaceae bacterium]
MAHSTCNWSVSIETQNGPSDYNTTYSVWGGGGSATLERTTSIEEDTYIVEQFDEIQGHLKVRYTVDISRNSVKMCVHETDETALMAVVRILRCVFIYELLTNGWIPFHAAAVKLKNRVICISGDKFSGKTTAMMAALKNWRASFISNDKIFIKNTGDVVYVCALPISVGVRRYTSELFSLKTKQFSTGSGGARMSFSPREIAAFFNVDVDRGGWLSSIIIPHYIPNCDECGFKEVTDNAEYEDFFLRQYLSDIFKHHSFWQQLALRNGLFVRENVLCILPSITLWLPCVSFSQFQNIRRRERAGTILPAKMRAPWKCWIDWAKSPRKLWTDRNGHPWDQSALSTDVSPWSAPR